MLLLLTSIGALLQEGRGASFYSGGCNIERHVFGGGASVRVQLTGGRCPGREGANVLRSAFLGTAVHVALVSAADSM